MITKKFLTLGLVLSLLSPISSFAGMGTETSGGGDAVYINNQMVIRDLLMHDQLEMKVNLDFLNEVPEFKVLMGKISQANPDFAYKVIKDLFNARIYMSPKSIPVLPYEQTTIAGKAADVQLALRDKNDIIFAPEFEVSTQKEYILLHEALHGILTDNVGAMHHQRVRNIVKYVYDNQNKLNAEGFTEFLAKNNYDISVPAIASSYTKVSGQDRFYSDFDYTKFIMFSLDFKTEDGLRCYYSRALPSMIRKFQGLECNDDNFDFQNFYERKIPNISKLMKELKSLNTNPENINVFTLTKDTFLNVKKKKSQQESCTNNLKVLNELKELKQDRELRMTIFKLGKDLKKDSSLTNTERLIIVENLFGKDEKSIDETMIMISNQLSITNKSIEILKTQQVACQKQYPELF